MSVGEKPLPLSDHVVRDYAYVAHDAEVLLRRAQTEADAFFRHEQVEALHRASRAGLDLNGEDGSVVLHEVVDLGCRVDRLTVPVEQPNLPFPR